VRHLEPLVRGLYFPDKGAGWPDPENHVEQLLAGSEDIGAVAMADDVAFLKLGKCAFGGVDGIVNLR